MNKFNKVPCPHLTRRVTAACFSLALYFIYALIRDAADGWYAYWFLNSTSLPPAQMALNVVILLLAFSVVALGFVVLDKRLAQHYQKF